MARSQKPAKSYSEIARLRDEYLPLLGKVSDGEIAPRADVCSQTVQRWRHNAAIAPYAHSGAKPKQWTPEKEKLLGTLPDAKLAEQIGIPPGTVAGRRRALGIPSCKLRSRPYGSNLTRIDGQKIRARRLALGLTYDAATRHNKTRKAHLAKMEAGQISAVTRQTLKWLCQSLRCKKQTIMPTP